MLNRLSHPGAPNIYLFFERHRETEHKLGRDRERRRHRTEAGSRLRAVGTEPDAGLELTNREITTLAEVGRSTDGAPRAPLHVKFY